VAGIQERPNHVATDVPRSTYHKYAHDDSLYVNSMRRSRRLGVPGEDIGARLGAAAALETQAERVWESRSAPAPGHSSKVLFGIPLAILVAFLIVVLVRFAVARM
jgi:hypothetical protein